MAYSPLEIITVVFAVIVLIKLVIVSFNPKSWIDNIAVPIYKNPSTSSVVMTLVAALIFYYLLAELTIVQIYAVIAFTSMLIGVSFMHYSKDMLTLVKHVSKRKIEGSMWILMVFWFLVSVWAIWAVLFI